MNKKNLLCFLTILGLFVGAQCLALSVTLHNKSQQDIILKYRTCWRGGPFEEYRSKLNEEGFEVINCPEIIGGLYAYRNVCKTGDKILLEKGKSYTIAHAGWVNNIQFFDVSGALNSNIKFYGNDGNPMPAVLESWFNNYEYTFK